MIVNRQIDEDTIYLKKVFFIKQPQFNRTLIFKQIEEFLAALKIAANSNRFHGSEFGYVTNAVFEDGCLSYYKKHIFSNSELANVVDTACVTAIEREYLTAIHFEETQEYFKTVQHHEPQYSQIDLSPTTKSHNGVKPTSHNTHRYRDEGWWHSGQYLKFCNQWSVLETGKYFQHNFPNDDCDAYWDSGLCSDAICQVVTHPNRKHNRGDYKKTNSNHCHTSGWKNRKQRKQWMK